MNEIVNQTEFIHLKPKIPIIPVNLVTELKTSNFGKLNKDLMNISEFNLNEYLNYTNTIMGLYLPMPFKLYESFEQNCHQFYEVLLSTKSYRS
jgi:hypothetical protein